MNGRLWNVSSHDLKLGFVLGVSEGSSDASLEVLCNTLKNTEMCKNTDDFVPGPKNLKTGEIVKSLDAFFREPANATIPVAFALRYVKRKAQGATDAELKAFEGTLRKAFYNP
jgi:hypothetical protein